MSQPLLFPDIDSGATFSFCRRYRYKLWRIWDADLPVCNFLMLNPSTADEMVPDPTITRCLGYSKAWGFGGLVVTNLFAFKATYPCDLWKAEDPIGPDNDAAILEAAKTGAMTICAWGADPKLGKRGVMVRERLHFERAICYYMSLTKSGQPGHPLYLRSDLKPIRWEMKLCQ